MVERRQQTSVKNTPEPAEESLWQVEPSVAPRKGGIEWIALRSIWVVSRKYVFRPMCGRKAFFILFYNIKDILSRLEVSYYAENTYL